MSLKIENHLLVGEGVKTQLVSGKDSGLFKRLDTIVYHYTGGSSLSGAVDTLTSPKVKACAHLVFGDAGEIVQLMPFNKITWHAGESKWRDRIGLNQYSIGFEMRNAGFLTKSGTVFRTAYGKELPKEQVMYAQHRNEKVSRYWEVYAERLLSRVRDVTDLLIDTYDIKYMLGHEEIAPGRKSDPGPAFPLDKMRNDFLNNNREAAVKHPTSGIITTTVNIRKQASALSDIIGVLHPKTEISVVGEKDGFYEIVSRGFVKKEFIEGSS